MAPLHPLVLDANILIRGVLGEKVRNLLINSNASIEFFVPDICVRDAEKYLPIILSKRSIKSESALLTLSELLSCLRVVEKELYEEYSHEAKQRIEIRDIHDWPVVATALMINAPIWTEDQDFFGSGISTWTTDRIHLFFKQHQN
jgi:predicted nucleic acid-binding protein